MNCSRRGAYSDSGDGEGRAQCAQCAVRTARAAPYSRYNHATKNEEHATVNREAKDECGEGNTQRKLGTPTIAGHGEWATDFPKLCNFFEKHIKTHRGRANLINAHRKMRASPNERPGALRGSIFCELEVFRRFNFSRALNIFKYSAVSEASEA